MNIIKNVLKSVPKLAANVLLGYGKINSENKGVINLIDVGSSSGELPFPWYKKSNHIKKLLCFDPQVGDFEKKNIITVGKGLWKETTNIPLYHCHNPSGASLFEQNFEYVDANFERLKYKGSSKHAATWHKRSKIKNIENVEVTTLDKIIESLNLDYTFDFLKIDAQGAEYEILLGSEKFLEEDCIGLHLELFNIPLYKGIKLEPEVTEYLKKYDFSLVKKFPYHGSFDSQNDCLYLKNNAEEKERHKNSLKEIYDL